MTATDQPWFIHREAAWDTPDVTDRWGTMSWLTDMARHGVGATIGYVEITVGETNPLHVHANCSEILVLLEGELSHVVGEDAVDLRSGDLLIVPPGMSHRAANPGSLPAKILIVYDSGARQFEAVG